MRRRVVWIGVAAAMAIWAGIAIFVVLSGRTGSSVTPTIFPRQQPNVFFDARYFGGSEERPAEGDRLAVAGAVVPHHQLAGSLTGEIFAILREKKPATVILVGPNHLNKGAAVTTSALDWQTPFGTVAAEREIIARLQKDDLAVKDDQLCGQENSLGSIMPYIKYYLPKAKVVPLILNGNLTLAESKALGANLAELGGDGAVVIASVDFSHYLPETAASARDQETLAALRAGNLGRIFQMGDDYLDSPPALGVLFGAMEAAGSPEFRLMGQSNSARILQQELKETTSYLTLIFPRPDQGEGE